MNRRLTQSVLNILSFTPQSGAFGGGTERFDGRTWERGLSWLDGGGVSLYFWRRIQEMGMQSALPPRVRGHLDQRQAENSQRISAMAEEWGQFQALVNSAGARCLMLKGLAAVPDYCPDPSLRVQFDHDCLIDRDSLPRVEEVLRRAGYRRKTLHQTGRVLYTPPDATSLLYHDPADSYSVKLARPIELHVDLWDSAEDGIALTLPNDLLARTTTGTWGGTTFRTLSSEDALLFQALHAFRHIIHNWCRLSVLYEISNFLEGHHSDRAFWQRFCARIEGNVPLRRIAGVVCALAASVFKVSAPFANLPPEFFALTPEMQLWVDRHGKESAPYNFSTNKFSLFLLREFMTEEANWREVRRRRLFPVQLPPRLPRANNRGILPALGARFRRAIHITRRFGFHIRAAFSYGWEGRRWRVLTRHSRGETQSTAFGLGSSERGDKRASLSAAKSNLGLHGRT